MTLRIFQPIFRAPPWQVGYRPIMEMILGIGSPLSLVFVMAVAVFGGLVKGLVGFAMPMVLMSGLTLILPPEQALAALIIPTFITNIWQALRQGLRSAWTTLSRFWVFLAVGTVGLIASAQLVRMLDAQVLYGVIGGPITVFACLQLAGWRPRLHAQSKPVEAVVGVFTGMIGGVSGVCGPPTVTYLTAIDLPKQEHMRAQGTIYGLFAIVLAGAHLQTGVLRAQTLPLTAVILPLALLGLWVGFKLQDRIDQVTFRKAILLVLIVAGLNLLRRAIWG